MGGRKSTRVDEGRNARNLLAITMQGTKRSGEGRGGESLLCDPGSELRLQVGGREKRRANIITDMK